MFFDNISELITNGQYEEANNELCQISENIEIDTYSIYEFEIKKGLGYSIEELLGCLERGMAYNYKNYELYVCLGEAYIGTNPNQSYICFEQALKYCDNEHDRIVIMDMMQGLKDAYNISVKNYSIVIVSYNCIRLMKECIESIRNTCLEETYEIIVVDNNSTDGIVEWLELQNDIKLIKNGENYGFGKASNQGVKGSEGENDIFFLNNDTVLADNSVFWLRFGLYSEDKVGATGAVSNYVSPGQRVGQELSKDECMEFAKANNILKNSMYELKPALSGFALFIKRTVLEKTGLFDGLFGLGYYEDDDLCIRIMREGYKSLICHNSFIYHYGSQSFQNNVKATNDLLKNNRQLFINKWGFDITYYSYARKEIIDFITDDINKEIKVLEIGCGLGTTLTKIKAIWKNAEIKGVEIVDEVQKLASKNLDIIHGDIETVNLPYEKEHFDYIICGDVLEHLRDPKATLEKLKEYLTANGKIIASIPNFMHCSSLLPLLRGDIEYKDSGILDRTHLKFFTLTSIVRMFYEAGMVIDKRVVSTQCEEEKLYEEGELVEGLVQLLGEGIRDELTTYQYVVCARRM